MANNINLIKKYGATQLDTIFMRESLTSILEANNNKLLKFEGTKTVYIPDIMMSGLADYSRTEGYSQGDVNLSWKPHEMSKDRGRKFSVDAMDNEETAGLAFGQLASEFERTKVVPEVDAYRFSKLFKLAYSKAGETESEHPQVETGTIQANTIINQFNLLIKKIQNAEMRPEDFIIFISPEVEYLIKQTNELEKKISQIDYKQGDITIQVNSYNKMPLIVVPQSRFKTEYTFGTDGFVPTAEAKDINFLAVHRGAAVCVKKHNPIKVIMPENNQNADAYNFYMRLYHDIFVPANKIVGIFAHIKD